MLLDKNEVDFLVRSFVETFHAPNYYNGLCVKEKRKKKKDKSKNEG